MGDSKKKGGAKKPPAKAKKPPAKAKAAPKAAATPKKKPIAAASKKPSGKPVPAKAKAAFQPKKPIGKTGAAKPAPKAAVSLPKGKTLIAPASKTPVKGKAPAVPAPARPASPTKPEAKGKAAAKPTDAKGKVAVKPAGKAAKPEETETPEPVKRPVKLFFLEVKPGSERVIKRGDKSLAAPAPLDIQARRKGTTAEESPEELVERIERELEHQFFVKRNAMRPQMCTKCGINPVAVRFTIDRELGYCDDCAEILRLGETKEARRMEFNAQLAKAEGEAKPPPGAEGDSEDEDSGPAPAVPDVD